MMSIVLRGVKLNQSFYKDPVFHMLLISPLAIWLLIFIENPHFLTIKIRPLLMVVVIIPIIEEIIFRGLLQTWLAKRYSRKLIFITQANLITSCIFVLAHLYQHNLIMALYTFVPSLIFGYSRDRYKRLMPSIILHSSYNGGYFLIGAQLIN